VDTLDVRGWLEHLTTTDLDLLARVAPAAGVGPAELRCDDAAIGRVLAHPETYDAVLAPGDEALHAVSPFLTFAVVVHRGWAELHTASHVDEWVGPRRRLPVLGTGELRDFLGAVSRRLFLAELLASYTRVASGSTWVRTTRGWRRRRFSELDPLRLASLLEVVPEPERPGVYRRLGDLSLFLTGVFPDHTSLEGLGAAAGARLGQLTGVRGPDGGAGTGDLDAVSLLEWLGARWYRVAVRAAPQPPTAALTVVADVADRFTVARRVLNYLTDRYLFARRAGWFGQPG